MSSTLQDGISLTTIAGLGINFAIVGIVSTFSLTGFVLLRNTRRFGFMYHARCLNEFNSDVAHGHCRNSDIKSLPRLLINVIKTPFKEFQKLYGPDAAVFLRLVIDSIYICLFATFCGLFLIPTHLYFGSISTNIKSDETPFFYYLESYSISQIPISNQVMLLHTIFTYFISIFICLIMRSTINWFIEMVCDHYLELLKSNDIAIRTIMIKGLPKALRTEEALFKHIEALRLGRIESISIFRRMGKLESKISKRNNAFRELEYAHMRLASRVIRKKYSSAYYPARLVNFIESILDILILRTLSMFFHIKCFLQKVYDLFDAKVIKLMSLAKRANSKRKPETHALKKGKHNSCPAFLCDENKSPVNQNQNLLQSPNTLLNLNSVQEQSETSQKTDKISAELGILTDTSLTQGYEQNVFSSPDTILTRENDEKSATESQKSTASPESDEEMITAFARCIRINELDKQEDEISSKRQFSLSRMINSRGSFQSSRVSSRDDVEQPVEIESSVAVWPTSSDFVTWEFLTDRKNSELIEEFLPKRQILGQKPQLVYEIDYLYQKVKCYDDAISGMRDFNLYKKSWRAGSTAFVTFKSPISAVIFSTCNTLSLPGSRVLPAPEPREIFWSSFALSRSKNRKITRIVTSALIIIFILLWTIPVLLVVSSSVVSETWEKLIKSILNDINVTAYSKALLPSLVTSIFKFLTPFILFAMLKLQGYYSDSRLKQRLTRLCFYYLIFNFLIIFITGNDIVAEITKLFSFGLFDISELLKTKDSELNAKSPFDLIFKKLAENFPRTSNFYIDFITFQCNFHPLELMQISTFLLPAWLRTSHLFTFVPRDMFRAQRGHQFPYYYYTSSFAIVLVFSIVYSLIQPIISFLALFHFLYAYVVYKHQLIHCYIPTFEARGQIFHSIFRWCMSALIIFQFTMASIFTGNQTQTFSWMLLPLPFCTVAFWIHQSKKLQKSGKYPPIDLLRKEEIKQFPDHRRKTIRTLTVSNIKRGSTYSLHASGNHRRNKSLTNGPDHQFRKAKRLMKYYHGRKRSIQLLEDIIKQSQGGGIIPSIDLGKDSDSFQVDIESLNFIRPSHIESELDNRNPQNYVNPCLTVGLPEAMWLPRNPRDYNDIYPRIDGFQERYAFSPSAWAQLDNYDSQNS